MKSSYLVKGKNIRQITAKIEISVLLLDRQRETDESQPLSSQIVSLPLNSYLRIRKLRVTQYHEELCTHRTSPPLIHIKFAAVPKAYSLASK